MNIRVLSLLVIAINVGWISMPALAAKPESDPGIQSGRPVKVILPQRRSFATTRQIAGTTYPNQDILISAQANGTVKSLFTDISLNVRKNQTLAQIDPEIYRLTLKTASANLAMARQTFEAQQQLFEKNMTSEQAFQGAKTGYEAARAGYEQARLALDNTNVKSPIFGVVAEKLVNIGEFVNVGRPVFRLVDISSIKVRVGVPQGDVDTLRVGTMVRVAFPGLFSKELSGRVANVAMVADKDSKAYNVEVLVANRSGDIRPGMLCRVKYTRRSVSDAMVVPSDVVIQDGQTYVYVVVGNKAVKRRIQVLISEDNQTAVKGLKPGERVVSVGQAFLKDKDQVRIIN